MYGTHLIITHLLLQGLEKPYTPPTVRIWRAIFFLIWTLPSKPFFYILNLLWITITGRKLTKSDVSKKREDQNGFPDGSDCKMDKTVENCRILHPDSSQVSSLKRCFSSLNLEKLEPVRIRRWGSMGSVQKRPKITLKTTKVHTEFESLPVQEQFWTLPPNYLIDVGLLLFSGIALLYYHYIIVTTV